MGRYKITKLTPFSCLLPEVFGSQRRVRDFCSGTADSSRVFRIGDVLRFENRERSLRIVTAFYGSRQQPACSVCTDRSANKLVWNKAIRAAFPPGSSWIAMEPYGLKLAAVLSYSCRAGNPSSTAAKLGRDYQPAMHTCTR